MNDNTVLLVGNRGSRRSYIIRMVINGIWIVLGLIYAGVGFSLQDSWNMARYVASGGAYHDTSAEIIIGFIITALSLYCLLRNFLKSQVMLIVGQTGIRGKDSLGNAFNLPFSSIKTVRIVKSVLIIDTQTGQLVFKKIKNMAQIGNLILDSIGHNNLPKIPR